MCIRDSNKYEHFNLRVGKSSRKDERVYIVKDSDEFINQFINDRRNWEQFQGFYPVLHPVNYQYTLLNNTVLIDKYPQIKNLKDRGAIEMNKIDNWFTPEILRDIFDHISPNNIVPSYLKRFDNKKWLNHSISYYIQSIFTSYNYASINCWIEIKGN